MAGMKPKHRNSFRHYEPGLIGIGTDPHFAIGQRAMLIRTPQGNVLWDCISFLDEATAEVVHALGGIAAIAISHPHFYSSMVDWSHEFGNAPIHLHEADRQWVMRPDPAIRFWSGASEQVMDGITLFNTGGHFEGATVLHWRDGASGRGALFTGDVVTVAADRRQATFHAQLSELHPPARRQGCADRRHAEGGAVRARLWRLVGFGDARWRP